MLKYLILIVFIIDVLMWSNVFNTNVNNSLLGNIYKEFVDKNNENHFKIRDNIYSEESIIDEDNNETNIENEVIQEETEYSNKEEEIDINDEDLIDEDNNGINIENEVIQEEIEDSSIEEEIDINDEDSNETNIENEVIQEEIKNLSKVEEVDINDINKDIVDEDNNEIDISEYLIGASSWAIEDLTYIIKTNCFELYRFNNYKSSITRNQFVYFVVRLYEILNKEYITIDNNVSFIDTDNLWVKKGATVGITNGVGNSMFGSNQFLTREQLVTMLIRTLIISNISLNSASSELFVDDANISEWAKNSIYIARSNGIVYGDDVNYMNPKSNTTVEEAIIMISRALKKYRSVLTNPVKAVKIPILMYHHIDNNVISSAVVSPQKFVEDMNLLRNNGYHTVFLEEIYDYLLGNVTLPSKPIVITFDDGYYSNYEYAFSIAKQTGMKFTISIIGWSVGRNSFINCNQSIIPHFSWIQAKEMYNSGLIDIQNHTFDLHSPKGLSYGYQFPCNQGVLPLDNENYDNYLTRLSNDLLRLKYDIWNNINKCSRFFIYPYGAYNNITEKALNDLNFIGSITTKNGVRTFRKVSDMKLIPRLNVDNNLSGNNLLNAINNLPSL